MESLSDRLRMLECPVNWNLEEALSKKRLLVEDVALEIQRFQYDLLKKKGSDVPFAVTDGSAAFQKCSQLMTLAWTEYVSETNGMRKYMEEIDEFLEAIGDDVQFIKRHLRALKYVVNGMWAHYFWKEKDEERVGNYLGFLPSYNELGPCEQACVMGLRACVFMEFGPAGHDGALSAINKALELKEDEAEWNFLKGKCISRTRRALNFRSAPTKEELFHLRKAVEKKDGSAFHYVYCGQSIKEYASYSPECRDSEKYMSECEEMMTIAAIVNDGSPFVLTRIAKGLMHMPQNRAFNLVENCVLRAYELYPESGLINHVAGNFYMYRKKDDRLAIFHLKLAALTHGVFGAFINLLDMVWKTCTETNIDPLVDQFWSQYRDSPSNRVKALQIMAAFHFFVKNDLLKALSFYREWMRAYDDRYDSRPSLFIPCYDLTEPLVGEVQAVLQVQNSIDTNDEKTMRDFLIEVQDFKPDLDLSKVTLTRKELIQRVLSKMNSLHKRVVAPKIPDISERFPNEYRSSYRIPARRAESRERILPNNWRQ